MFHITGVSATSSVGSPTVFNEQGWGRDTWGSENWGESAITVSLTGVSATATLGPILHQDGETRLGIIVAIMVGVIQ